MALPPPKDCERIRRFYEMFRRASTNPHEAESAPKSPLPGNGISWAETKAPRRPRRLKDSIAETERNPLDFKSGIVAQSVSIARILSPLKTCSASLSSFFRSGVGSLRQALLFIVFVFLLPGGDRSRATRAAVSREFPMPCCSTAFHSATSKGRVR